MWLPCFLSWLVISFSAYFQSPIVELVTFYYIFLLLSPVYFPLARADNFDVPLVNGKRAPWFTAKVPSFFEAGGILAAYRKSAVNSVRKKFNEAEAKSKIFYNSGSHQETHSTQDEALPLFASIFFKYVDFMQTRWVVAPLSGRLGDVLDSPLQIIW